MKTTSRTTGTLILTAASMIAALLVATAPAVAQCTFDWAAVPGVSGVGSPTIYAMTVWDPDGSGPAHPLLIAGGEFATAGAVSASNIAAWDGIGWMPLGGGLNGPVYALTSLPTGELIAGGGFTAAGSTPTAYVASWNGTVWGPMGSGMNNGVNCLTVTPNGTLFAGGFFTTAGGLTANRVARWNGTNWSSLGAGLNSIVYTMAAMPNGNVYAGGAFTTSGSSLRTRIARWDGAAWQAAGTMNSVVMGLAALADGSIAATGNFTTAGATRVNYAATSSGGGIWTPLGGTGLNMPGRTLALREDGSLLAGGFFTLAGATPANRIASLNGSTWSALGNGIDAVVLTICEYGNETYAGGAFTTSGAVPSLCFARYAPASAITIMSDPTDAHVCLPGSLILAIEANGSGELGYQWRHDGIAIDAMANPSAATNLLTLDSASWGDLGTYDCVVSDACASVTSRAAQVSACAGDFNCDGGVDGSDIESFFRAWESGETFADVNVDGGVDGADVEMFFRRWEAGC
ncbi:MAG: hypothetical protein NTV94_00385 [Planctomycetota bacterium]|nr:hypothetical protein [Planctomycetota bacterium]